MTVLMSFPFWRRPPSMLRTRVRFRLISAWATSACADAWVALPAYLLLLLRVVARSVRCARRSTDHLGLLCRLATGSLSERFGRRHIIIIAAVLSLVVLPLWAFAASAVWLAIGAFLMQVMVQGAWGVIPVHLNELSPDDSRGTFPGFVYQLGNLIASFNATLQAGIAAHYGGQLCLGTRGRGGCGCGRDYNPYRFRHRSKRRGIRNRSHPRPSGPEDRGEFGYNLI